MPDMHKDAIRYVGRFEIDERGLSYQILEQIRPHFIRFDLFTLSQLKQ